jgi:dTDP-4-dehydrorhamnose 3,5-epimerase-like enzyme
LSDASTFVEVIEKRQGLKVACLEAVAFNHQYRRTRKDCSTNGQKPIWPVSNKLGARPTVIPQKMTLKDSKIIALPKILDSRGNLSFAEQYTHIPFEIKRTYWIYDVPGGEARGGHAYKENEEFIIALSGSFDVILDDGTERKTFSLNRSYYGLYVPKGLWRQMDNFSTNSLALVLASTSYNADDYIFDYSQFKSMSLCHK